MPGGRGEVPGGGEGFGSGLEFGSADACVGTAGLEQTWLLL